MLLTDAIKDRVSIAIGLGTEFSTRHGYGRQRERLGVLHVDLDWEARVLDGYINVLHLPCRVVVP